MVNRVLLSLSPDSGLTSSHAFNVLQRSGIHEKEACYCSNFSYGSGSLNLLSRGNGRKTRLCLHSSMTKCETTIMVCDLY